MEFTLNAYSMVFSEHNAANRLEYGNKILLPSIQRTFVWDVNKIHNFFDCF